MTTLLREQLTTLLALVIFLEVKQEAFMFNYAVIITTALWRGSPLLPAVVQGSSVKTDCKEKDIFLKFIIIIPC